MTSSRLSVVRVDLGLRLGLEQERRPALRVEVPQQRPVLPGGAPREVDGGGGLPDPALDAVRRDDLHASPRCRWAAPSVSTPRVAGPRSRSAQGVVGQSPAYPLPEQSKALLVLALTFELDRVEQTERKTRAAIDLGAGRELAQGL